MPMLCNLPWCRKPMAKEESRHFPSDRPTQLAWLDALDAGGWFSIPSETLATGLLICTAHFDEKGDVKRRYEVSPRSTPSSPPTQIKLELEPLDFYNEDEDSELEDSEDSEEDEHATQKDSATLKNTDDVKVDMVHQKTLKRNRSSESPSTSKGNARGLGSTKKRKKMTFLDSIDERELSKFTEEIICASMEEKIKEPPKQRRALSVMQKMDIIRLFDSGMKQSNIAKKLNLTKSTISGTIAQREKIQETYNEGESSRKKIRRGLHDEVNQALFAWYERAKGQNLFINSKVLVAMAEKIAAALGKTAFNASQGWLDKFKLRHNIRFGDSAPKPRKTRVKKAKQINTTFELTDEFQETESSFVEATFSGDPELLKQDWLKKSWPLYRKIKSKTGLLNHEKDIFFGEEIQIVYRISPKQAWQLHQSQLSEIPDKSEILTLFLCANSDGSEKEKLIVAGTANPTVKTNLPVSYNVVNDSSSSIPKSVFEQWIKEWDAKLKSENRKIILLLNSSILQSDSNSANIRIVNLPAQCLYLLHPACHGIRTEFRSRYRRLLLETLLKKNSTLTSNKVSISCLDAAFLLNTAWNELPPTVIKNAFIAAGLLQDYAKGRPTNSLALNDLDFSELLSRAESLDLAITPSQYSFADYVGIDDYLSAKMALAEFGQTDTTATSADREGTRSYGSGDGDHQDLNYVSATPVFPNDIEKYLHEIRVWSLNRHQCPQEVHNAISTLESFVLGHIT